MISSPVANVEIAMHMKKTEATRKELDQVTQVLR
jgi:hypothetical protein